MKIIKALLIFFSATITLAGCKKERESSPGSPKPKNVYVAGSRNISGLNKAMVWKNGIPEFLSNSFDIGEAYSVFIANNDDVYACGYARNDASAVQKAVYWKNNKQFVLSSASDQVDAISISVNGSDIYVCGNNYEKGEAVYWKNDKPVFLTAPSSRTYSLTMFVNGSDVYIAGYAENIATMQQRAVYWKNGNLVNLTDGKSNAIANSIIVSGTDVYVAGKENAGSTATAKYWKNGSPVILGNGSSHSEATSIALSGSTVYTAGYEQGTVAIVPKYWRNNEAFTLNEADPGRCNAVVAAGNDIYICGTSRSSGNKAVYWKNGIKQFQDSSATDASRAYNIFVK